MGGLRYETGREMPPGMLEKVAVKLAADLSAEAEAKRAGEYDAFLHSKATVYNYGCELNAGYFADAVAYLQAEEAEMEQPSLFDLMEQEEIE